MEPFEGDTGRGGDVSDGQGRRQRRADSQDKIPKELILWQHFQGCSESAGSWILTDTQTLGKVSRAPGCSSDAQVRTSVALGF